MLFHAFRVVYTGKEFDSHAKHGQSFKKKFGRITVFLCQKSHFRIRTSFGEFFSIVVLYDVNDGGTPYMGISPGKNASVHASSRVRARRAPINAVPIGRLAAGPRSGRMSLKKCVFGCEGKITLFSFPKQPTVT